MDIRKLAVRLELGRGLKLIWQASRKWVVVALLLSVALSLLPVLALYLQKLFFDFFTYGLLEERGLDPSTLFWLVFAMAAVQVVVSLLGSVSAYANAAQSEIVKDHVMEQLHRKSIELDLSFYETPAYFDSLHIAQKEAPNRIASFVQSSSGTFRDALSLLSVLALLITYHWAISILLLVAFVPGLLVHLKSSDKLFRWQKAAASRQRETEYYHELLTQAPAAKESRVFQFGKVVSRWYSDLRRKLREELLVIAYWKQTRVFVVSAFATIALFVGVYLFTRGTANGQYTVGDMALFYAAFVRCQGYLKSLTAGVSSIYESNLFLGNLFEVLDTKPKVVSRKKAVPAKKTGSVSLAFNSVTFRYPGTQREAVSELNLSIEPGEHIAIVGKNGSGKSTFVKLLCRLYDPSNGTVTANGVDIREFDLLEHRSRFSVLFQDYLQYSLSVRDNIWLGDSKREQAEGIAEAAKLSGASEFIGSLPKSYDTLLGKVLAEGEQLSQGEWQKVALARALFAKAEITILDEPTSWMDPESELAFFERFHEVSKGRTAIMISHRLSTVKMVDRIVVLEHGRIVEVGTHSSLVAKRGRYFELFETQAQNYR